MNREAGLVILFLGFWAGVVGIAWAEAYGKANHPAAICSQEAPR